MNQSVWIPRAQDGDRTAVAQLFEQTVQPVYYLCCKLTGSAAQAGSLTRRTFDRAFSELSSIRPGVSFSRWTMAIAVNLCRQQLAASQPELLRTDEAEQAMLNDTYVTGEDCLPAACVTDEALQEQALQAVDQLPPRQRVCLYLHSYAKLQPAQIARVLGLPEVTVLGRLNCARYTLRTLLEPLSPTPLSPVLPQLLEAGALRCPVPEVLHGSCLQTAWQAAQATPEQPQSEDKPEDEADEADGTDEPERKKLTKKQKILIGVGAGLLLAVIVLVCVLLGGKDKTPDETPAPVEQVDTNLESAALLEKYGVEVLLTCNERESQKLIDDWQSVLPDYVVGGNPDDLQLQTQVSDGMVSQVSLSLVRTSLDITRLDNLGLGEKPLASATADALRQSYGLACCPGQLLFDPVASAGGALCAYSDNYRYEFLDADADGMYDGLVITRAGAGWDADAQCYRPYGDSLRDLLGLSRSEAQAILSEGGYADDGVDVYTMPVSGCTADGGGVQLTGVMQARTQLDGAKEAVNVLSLQTDSGCVGTLLPELQLPAGALSLSQVENSLSLLSGHLGALDGDVFDALAANAAELSRVVYYEGDLRYSFFSSYDGGTVEQVEVLDLSDCKLWNGSGFETDNFDLQKLLGLDPYEAYKSYGIRAYNFTTQAATALGLWQTDGVIRTVYNAADSRPAAGVHLGDTQEDILALVEDAKGYCYARDDTSESYVLPDKLELKVTYADGAAESLQLMDYSNKSDYKPPEALASDPADLFADFLKTQQDVRTSYMADLNHDGSPELLVCRPSGSGCLAQLYVLEKRAVNTTPVYSVTLDAATGGGTNLYCFENADGVWLMLYTDISTTGSASRSYRIYSINAAGAEVILAQNDAKINVLDQLTGDTEAYETVKNEVDGYLPSATYICGTMDGSAQFAAHSVA